MVAPKLATGGTKHRIAKLAAGESSQGFCLSSPAQLLEDIPVVPGGTRGYHLLCHRRDEMLWIFHSYLWDSDRIHIKNYCDESPIPCR